MAEVLELPALKVVSLASKPDTFFYVLRMSALTLAKMKRVPVRRPSERKGIQRLSDEKRIREIAAYILNKKASFPNTIIVSFEGDVKVTCLDQKLDFYLLQIPVEENSAVIIDGQHRLLGIERSGVDMQIIVTAYLKIEEARQATIFRDINFYQRKVNKSLMYDLFHITKDAEFSLMRAIDITEQLNEEGPLESRIKLTGVGEGNVSQTIFVETIQRLLTNGEIFRQPEYETEDGLEIQTGVTKAFFESLKGKYKEAWDDPRHYILLKTAGIYGLIMLLKDILWFYHAQYAGKIPEARDFEPFTSRLAKSISFVAEEYGDNYLGESGLKRFHQLLLDTTSELLR